jgi:hypothetical protein
LISSPATLASVLLTRAAAHELLRRDGASLVTALRDALERL